MNRLYWNNAERTEIKDYKIAPEYMTKCVVEKTAQNMAGVFPLDPKRLLAYRNYTKMLTLSTLRILKEHLKNYALILAQLKILLRHIRIILKV